MGVCEALHDIHSVTYARVCDVIISCALGVVLCIGLHTRRIVLYSVLGLLSLWLGVTC